MNPALIAAGLLSLVQAGREATLLIERWESGTITPEELAAEWTAMQQRLAAAGAAWDAAGQPAVDGEH
ncbi:MAG: hypothetical protein ABTQ30_15090 [Rhizobiaceae bacterium]